LIDGLKSTYQQQDQQDSAHKKALQPTFSLFLKKRKKTAQGKKRGDAKF
jgi:hypothetical protein